MLLVILPTWAVYKFTKEKYRTMTIQEFRDYMASGKPVIGGSDVHMIIDYQRSVNIIGSWLFFESFSKVFRK